MVNPEGLAPPAGFAHAVVAAPGRTVYLGGQAAQAPDGEIAAATWPSSSRWPPATWSPPSRRRRAPEHLVPAHLHHRDRRLRASLAELGAASRRHLGRHYAAMALFQVAGLFDPQALVELVAAAVVPDWSQRSSHEDARRP